MWNPAARGGQRAKAWTLPVDSDNLRAGRERQGPTGACWRSCYTGSQPAFCQALKPESPGPCTSDAVREPGGGRGRPPTDGGRHRRASGHGAPQKGRGGPDPAELTVRTDMRAPAGIQWPRPDGSAILPGRAPCRAANREPRRRQSPAIAAAIAGRYRPPEMRPTESHGDRLRRRHPSDSERAECSSGPVRG